jgi:hypothetical protein
MGNSMLKPITITRDIKSFSDLNTYLADSSRQVAANSEVPGELFRQTTQSDWTRKVPGCLALFTPLIVTDELDEKSPLRKKIIQKKDIQPILSEFLPGISAPFSFEGRKVIPAGTSVWTVPLEPIAA